MEGMVYVRIFRARHSAVPMHCGSININKVKPRDIARCWGMKYLGRMPVEGQHVQGHFIYNWPEPSTRPGKNLGVRVLDMHLCQFGQDDSEPIQVLCLANFMYLIEGKDHRMVDVKRDWRGKYFGLESTAMPSVQTTTTATIVTKTTSIQQNAIQVPHVERNINDNKRLITSHLSQRKKRSVSVIDDEEGFCPPRAMVTIQTTTAVRTDDDDEVSCQSMATVRIDRSGDETVSDIALPTLTLEQIWQHGLDAPMPADIAARYKQESGYDLNDRNLNDKAIVHGKILELLGKLNKQCDADSRHVLVLDCPLKQLSSSLISWFLRRPKAQIHVPNFCAEAANWRALHSIFSTWYAMDYDKFLDHQATQPGKPVFDLIWLDAMCTLINCEESIQRTFATAELCDGAIFMISSSTHGAPGLRALTREERKRFPGVGINFIRCKEMVPVCASAAGYVAESIWSHTYLHMQVLAFRITRIVH